MMEVSAPAYSVQDPEAILAADLASAATQEASVRAEVGRAQPESPPPGRQVNPSAFANGDVALWLDADSGLLATAEFRVASKQQEDRGTTIRYAQVLAGYNDAIHLKAPQAQLVDAADRQIGKSWGVSAVVVALAVGGLYLTIMQPLFLFLQVPMMLAMIGMLWGEVSEWMGQAPYQVSVFDNRVDDC